MKRCVVVIPVYKKELSKDEEGCVCQFRKVLTKEDLIFICPESLDTTFYETLFPEIGYKRFPDRFFTGTKSYNHLMLDTKFYDAFSEYEYMLIAQTDAVLWSEADRLEEFMKLGYDYIGAPWIPERNIWEWRFNRRKENGKVSFQCCKKKGQGISMGNGGFCLRNINACKALIKECRWRKLYWFWKRNEDIFFGVCGEYNKSGFCLADVDTGLKFSREYRLRESVEKGEIPFGVHGWQKEFASYEEMKRFMALHGVKLA